MFLRVRFTLMNLMLFVAASLACLPALSQTTDEKVSAATQEVIKVENAFAQTLAKRDFKAFSEFIAEDAVFFTGKKVLRGKQAVLDGWEHFFDDPLAPFSWTPDEVEALLSGELASSSGPVHDAKGQQIARYVSIWRKQGERWQIVLDRGVDICLCKKD